MDAMAPSACLARGGSGTCDEYVGATGREAPGMRELS
jgi:hypothetical protein